MFFSSFYAGSIYDESHDLLVPFPIVELYRKAVTYTTKTFSFYPIQRHREACRDMLTQARITEEHCRAGALDHALLDAVLRAQILGQRHACRIAVVRQVKMPDVYPTNICFGGPDMRTAYITLSDSGRLGVIQRPEPGLKLNFG